MSITSPRVEDLARRLARATGEDLEKAVERAIEERLSRVAPPGNPERRAAMEKFLTATAKYPVLDDRTPDEIMDYGPLGVPE